MKISIIGSNSLLASYIIEQLCKDDAHYIRLFGKEAPSNKKANIAFEYFRYPENGFDLSSLLDQDVVIYCAATGVQANKAFDVSLIYEINAFLPIRIINYLSEKKFSGKWISFGSYFEIGDNEHVHAFNESEIVNSERKIPNHYCSSKRLLTKFISNSLYSVKAFHLILPTIYGNKENDSRLIPYIVEALSKGKPVQLSKGLQVRQYLHCKDVVSLVQLLASNDYPQSIYNVANEPPIQIAELIHYIYALFNDSANSALGTLSTRDEGMKYLALNTEKVGKHISQWKPTIGIKEGIKEYL
ncbi:NAD-dependent epimerase/dehydratase family protein [Hymenobacter mucosus]|uniref:Nucleoside-diphosphate-sugar epimerase n=1 Tax=Hymenobacter mucosus TaxID=1411120 RepID=A0A238YGG9_9BACT|nr:NAD(P)-dependent oxidoreductase [Hymenobacter mucosus]SNR69898.1 Nucleoside-diphosphate-sugar epimerase [Hymenobacter mucosus]